MRVAGCVEVKLGGRRHQAELQVVPAVVVNGHVTERHGTAAGVDVGSGGGYCHVAGVTDGAVQRDGRLPGVALQRKTQRMTFNSKVSRD